VSWLTGYAAPVRSWLAILVTLVACNESDTERMNAIRDQTCACKTASCAEQAMSQVQSRGIKSTPRVQALARDMMECVARLNAAERPTTDPDAEGGDTASGSAGAAPSEDRVAPPAAPAAGSGH
jgi:hypothetical protein